MVRLRSQTGLRVSTLNSNSTLLCPVAEFLKRIDPTVVAQLCTDDPTQPVAITDLPTNPVVLAQLTDACGMFESAALVGERYSAADLLTLATAVPQTHATSLMYRIVSDLAWVLLWERRPNKQVQPPPSLSRTEALLRELSMGTRIFGFREVEQAGHLDREDKTPDDVVQENLASFQASRFFGRRANMTPYSNFRPGCW